MNNFQFLEYLILIQMIPFLILNNYKIYSHQYIELLKELKLILILYIHKMIFFLKFEQL